MLSYIKKIKKLRKEKLFSICLAESCTGGMISSKLTSISGSSDFFDGSVVSYSNDLKKRLFVNQGLYEIKTLYNDFL